jgi:predicted RecB family nuclease
VPPDGTVIYGPKPPSPTPPPTPRTPLDKLDIDEATRKQLVQAGIVDVQGILEAEPAKLATIVGSEAVAKKLIEMARQLLASSPTQPPQVRTDLAKLGVDAATRKQLETAGVRDVEAVLEVGPEKLTEIVGDRATAAQLAEAARKLLASTPSPTPTPAGPRGTGRSTGKRAATKKPKTTPKKAK